LRMFAEKDLATSRCFVQKGKRLLAGLSADKREVMFGFVGESE